LSGSHQKQFINLLHKDDIFNYEFVPQHIETELLCGEQQRLSFALSFSSYKEESSIQMQKLSNNNFSDIKLDDNSLMFNSFKKIKIQNKNSFEKTLRNEFKGLQDSKMYSKYIDLNLQSQIMKEHPVNLLEVPSNK